MDQRGEPRANLYGLSMLCTSGRTAAARMSRVADSARLAGRLWASAPISSRVRLRRLALRPVFRLAASVHFHVFETVTGRAPRLLTSSDALDYPSAQPTFDSCDEAIEAAMASALEQWGIEAERHVETELGPALDVIPDHDSLGAVAVWNSSRTVGAIWSLKPCDCVNGSLAQLFNGRG